MNPNPQQLAVVNHEQGPCIVLAVPGSGKTTSVTERIKKLLNSGVNPKTILAITFTNKAAKEMRLRIANAVGLEQAGSMTVSTFHSLCARLLRANCTLVGLSTGFSIYDQDDSERLVKSCIKKINGIDYRPTDRYIKGIQAYLEGQRNACLSKEEALAKFEIDLTQSQVIDLYFEELKKANAVDFNGLISETNRLFDEHHDTRDIYRGRFKYISVDEVQDTNTAQYELIKHLGLGHKNVLVVGDIDQCIPVGSAVKILHENNVIESTIEKIAIGDLIESAAGRGEVKFSRIAAKTERYYKGNLIELTTKSGKVIKTTPNHILFGALEMMPKKYFVYLMRKNGLGFRIGRTISVRAGSKGQPILGLKIRANQEHADGIWLLKICDTLEDSIYWEAFFATQYGLPTICFHGNGRFLGLSDEKIVHYFNSIETESRAHKLLTDLDMLLEYPIVSTASREKCNRANLTISMFGGSKNRNNKHHLVTFYGESLIVKDQFERIGLKCTPGKRDLWRYRSAGMDYATLMDLAKSIKVAGVVSHITRKAFLVAKSGNEAGFLEHPASHFYVGMKIATIQDGVVQTDTVVERRLVPYDGPVFDLTIQDVSNFATQGVVCHNSIYAFRDARPENVLQFEKDFDGCKVLKLEKNYRSSPEILRHSQKLIERNKFRKGTTLTTDNANGMAPRIIPAGCDDAMADEIAVMVKCLLNEGVKPAEIAILYRTNAASRVIEQSFRASQIQYKLIGGMSFYDRAEVKASLAVLKLMSNPNDRMSFDKCVEACCRGAGDRSVESVLQMASTNSVSVLTAADAYVNSNSSAQAKAMKPFIDVIKSTDPTLPGKSLLDVARGTSFWEKMHDKSSPTNDRCQNIVELASDVEQYCTKKSSSLSGYLQNISLLSSQDDAEDDMAVKLMSMHASKGLEFDAVFISHCNFSFLPHYRCLEEAETKEEVEAAIEEERRLLYVAMTRARKHLTLLYAKSKHDPRQKKLVPMYPSMFLHETGIRCHDLNNYVLADAPNEPPTDISV